VSASGAPCIWALLRGLNQYGIEYNLPAYLAGVFISATKTLAKTSNTKYNTNNTYEKGENNA
jgi:hypothetical protein